MDAESLEQDKRFRSALLERRKSPDHGQPCDIHRAHSTSANLRLRRHGRCRQGFTGPGRRGKPLRIHRHHSGQAVDLSIRQPTTATARTWTELGSKRSRWPREFRNGLRRASSTTTSANRKPDKLLDNGHVERAAETDRRLGGRAYLEHTADARIESGASINQNTSPSA